MEEKKIKRHKHKWTERQASEKNNYWVYFCEIEGCEKAKYEKIVFFSDIFRGIWG